MKRLIVLFVAVLLVAAMLIGCGKSSDSGVAVDDLIVRKDSDNNFVVTDKDGAIASVIDQNGNSIDVDDYVQNHDGTAKSDVAGSDISHTVTFELDNDNNLVVRDKNSGIIFVNDKDGNEVDVDEYVSGHKGTKKSEALNPDSSTGNGSSHDTGSESSNDNGFSDNNGSESSGGSSSSVSNTDEIVEGEIPRTVVDVDTAETGPAFPDI